MRAIILQFPKPPCLEKWDSMDDNDLGKYCPVCKTDIFNFLDLTDDELVEILKYAPERVCGKFKASQLGRPIIVKEDSPVSKNPRFKTMLAATVMLAVATPFLNAQDVMPMKPSFVNVQSQADSIPLKEVGENLRVLKGRVLFALDDEPLVGVAVSIKGTKIGVVANIDGEYELKIPLNHFEGQRSIIIEFSFIGCEKREVEYIFSEPKMMDKLFSKIKMEEDSNILIGEIIIIRNDYYDPIYGR